MTDPAPRNHARRVEDLQALHTAGLLRFIESTPVPGRVYVVEVAGQRHEIPARLLDTWLDGWRSALTVNPRKPRRTGNGARENRILDTAEDT